MVELTGLLVIGLLVAGVWSYRVGPLAEIPITRVSLGQAVACWVVGAASGNIWLFLLMVPWGFHFMRLTSMDWRQWGGMVWASLALVAVIVAGGSNPTAQWVPWVLSALVVIGVGQTVWAVDGWRRFPNRYVARKGWLCWYEDRTPPRIECGQGNQNHAQALSAVCVAAVCGLAWLWSWWWLVLVPVLAVPIALVEWTVRHKGGLVSQGHLYLWHLALLGLCVWLGPWGWAVCGLYGLACLGLLYRWRGERHAPDTGRARRWYILLGAGWWCQPWTVRLLGQGWRSWIAWAERFVRADVTKNPDKADSISFMTAAHNEYVQALFEHGLVGFLGLVGLTVWAFWQAIGAGVIGQTLVPLLVILVTNACLSMPWTLYHETVATNPQTGVRVTSGAGAPGMQAVSIVVAILVLGVAR